MMAKAKTSSEPKFFATPGAFRTWLEKHGASSAELLVGFHKVDSGRPSMTWPQSVDEALCVGWIDGVRRRIDDSAYSIRFTPRRRDSNWSAVNIARVQVLTAEGRMQPAGLAAFEQRSEKRSGIYAYEQRDQAQFGAGELAAFRAECAAWEFFEKQPPGYRKLMQFHVMSAKLAATRSKRLAKLIEFSASGQRLR